MPHLEKFMVMGTFGFKNGIWCEREALMNKVYGQFYNNITLFLIKKLILPVVLIIDGEIIIYIIFQGSIAWRI